MQKIFSNTNQTRSIYFKLKQISIQKSCRLFSSVDDSKQQSLPRQADVVIAGGGVVACSIAYHLANRGLTNVLVLEKEKFVGNIICYIINNMNTNYIPQFLCEHNSIKN